MLTSPDKDFWLLQHAPHERPAVTHALREFVGRVQRRVDHAPQLRLGRLQGVEQFRVGRQCADHHQVDVAAGVLGSLGQRTVRSTGIMKS
jgi:hypothetical protein